MVSGQIKPVGVVDDRILDAFLTVPREIFVPEKLRGVCYADEEIKFTENNNDEYILSPALHAKMIEEASPSKEDVVLNIGDFSGYSSAIWSKIASTVFSLCDTIDYQEKRSLLWEQTKAHNIISVSGNILEGYEKGAPYNIIFINGAIQTLPEKLVEQLAYNGKIITVIRNSDNDNCSSVTVFKKDHYEKCGYTEKRRFYAVCPYVNGLDINQKFVFDNH